MRQPGRFLVIEGPEGAGKTTTAEAVTTWLNDTIGKPTQLVKSPGGSKFANGMRNLVFSGLTQSHQAEALGLLTAEVDCFESVIVPALQVGKWVIGDRWLMSGRIYQGFIRNRPIESIDKLIDAAIPSPRAVPDAYIVLNAAPDILLERVLKTLEVSQKEREYVPDIDPSQMNSEQRADHEEKLEQMSQVYEAEREALEGNRNYYQWLAAAYARPMVFSGGAPCTLIDTSEKTPEEVSEKVCEIIRKSVLSI